MFSAIDRMLMRFATRLCHSYQQRTGNSPYAIARIGFILCVIGSVLSVLDYFRQGTLGWETSWFDALVDATLIVSLALISIQMYHEDSDPRLYEERYMGRLIGQVWPFLRVLTVLLLIYAIPHGMYCEEHAGGPLVLKVLEHSWMLGACVILYFAPVEPLPKEFPQSPAPYD